MSTINNGGPAFPVTNPQFIYKAGAEAAKAGLSTDERDRLYMEATEQAASGMSLRDYFAATALIGLMSEPLMGNTPATAFLITRDESPVDTYAISAYRLADAMLAARGAA
jgi:hypothetical protein